MACDWVQQKKRENSGKKVKGPRLRIDSCGHGGGPAGGKAHRGRLKTEIGRVKSRGQSKKKKRRWERTGERKLSHVLFEEKKKNGNEILMEDEIHGGKREIRGKKQFLTRIKTM